MYMRALAILFLVIAIGCVGEPSESGVSSSPDEQVWVEHQAPVLQLTEAQENGKQLYDVFCWTCHGLTARGDGPIAQDKTVLTPPSFMEGLYAGMTAADFEARFDQENPARRLPGHMQYVRSVIEPDKFREVLEYLPVLTYPSAIPGSALSGSVIYATRCQLCHGETGMGDGAVGVTITSTRPANFTSDTLLAQKDWEGLFLKIRGGGEGPHTAMPRFGTVFSESELWDLVAYISMFQPGLFPPLAEVTSR
jgi:mono/diheme cytochrome c family protein